MAHWRAALLGLFSTANLALVYLLARRSGADADEAGLAALLGGRGEQPVSIIRGTCCLTTVPFAPAWPPCCWRCRRPPARRLAGGICAGLCFEIYNGYWFLVPVIGTVLLGGQPDWKSRRAAALTWGAGFLLVVGLIMLPPLAARGATLLGRSHRLQPDRVQGFFAEGWSLPWPTSGMRKAGSASPWPRWERPGDPRLGHPHAACAHPSVAAGGPGALRPAGAGFRGLHKFVV